MLRPDRKRHGLTGELGSQLALDDVGGADEAGDKRCLRSGVELTGRVELLDPPLVEHRHPIRHRQRFALIVGHIDEGDAQMTVQAFEFGLHLLPQLQIQRAQGLIQQQHLGAIDQRPRQRHPLPLAAGELGWLALTQAAQRHQLQRLLGAGHAIAAAHPLHLEAIGDVLPDIQVREQGVILKYGIHIPLIGRQAAGVDTSQIDGAQIRLFKPRHQPQAAGFAGA